MLREMGGVAFVYNLSKSSIVNSGVKETALFTLGTLAEANGRHVCIIFAESQFKDAFLQSDKYCYILTKISTNTR